MGASQTQAEGLVSYPLLRGTTSPEWVKCIEDGGLFELLSDHAHNELKAAATAQAWLLKNTDQPKLVIELSKVAAEELEHFERVVKLLYSRGGQLHPLKSNPYAEALLKGSAKTRRDPFLDRLIVAALIEARSCERFILLADHLLDPEVAGLYRDLIPCELGHNELFVDLVRESFPGEGTENRIEQLFDLEGEVIASLPFSFAMHSGMRPVA
ncbi:MAG: tRNA-(ms[2]io[6]A)-hydroxylase [Planctomycetota bacterium]